MKSNITKILIIISIVLSISLAILLLVYFTNQNSSNQESQKVEIIGTKWQLQKINGEEIKELATMEISENSEVGFRVCNMIGYGKVVLTKNKINFTENAMSTMMYCYDEDSQNTGESKIMKLEQRISEIFKTSAEYALKDEFLTIKVNGNEVIFIKLE